MKINYNVSGAERKTLVGAISQELNAPTKYLGAPTFAYEVGGYHIDKAGTVTGPDNLDMEDALHQRGFDAETREYDEPDTYENGLGGMGAVPTPEQVDAETQAWAEREMRRMRLESESVPDYSNRGQYGSDNIPETVADEDESCRLVIEMPLEGFTPEKLDNLAKLVNAKAPLLKAALGTDDLPIQQTADTLKFPWFGDGLDADTVKAYASLVGMICATAKEKHRITAQVKNPENKKYAMRCWLLSLSFIGDEQKTSRKILLSKLDGNSSFKNGIPPKEAESEVG